MNSDTFYRAPGDWVRAIIGYIEQRLGLVIKSSYYRQASALKGPLVSYHIGELETLNHTANDGRKLHEIELRLFVEIPLSVPCFDEEAADLSARITRELVNFSPSNNDNDDTMQLLTNEPSRFVPDDGVFARVIMLRQRIFMGPTDLTEGRVVGARGYAGSHEQPDIIVRKDGN